MLSIGTPFTAVENFEAEHPMGVRDPETGAVSPHPTKKARSAYLVGLNYKVTACTQSLAAEWLADGKIALGGAASEVSGVGGSGGGN